MAEREGRVTMIERPAIHLPGKTRVCRVGMHARLAQFASSLENIIRLVDRLATRSEVMLTSALLWGFECQLRHLLGIEKTTRGK